MPRALLLAEFGVGPYSSYELPEEDILSAARKFKVSPLALGYRLVNLGILKS